MVRARFSSMRLNRVRPLVATKTWSMTRLATPTAIRASTTMIRMRRIVWPIRRSPSTVNRAGNPSLSHSHTEPSPSPFKGSPSQQGFLPPSGLKPRSAGFSLSVLRLTESGKPDLPQGLVRHDADGRGQVQGSQPRPPRDAHDGTRVVRKDAVGQAVALRAKD